MDHVRVNTPTASGRSCAIANVGVTTLSPHELAERTRGADHAERVHKHGGIR